MVWKLFLATSLENFKTFYFDRFLGRSYRIMKVGSGVNQSVSVRNIPGTWWIIFATWYILFALGYIRYRSDEWFGDCSLRCSHLSEGPRCVRRQMGLRGRWGWYGSGSGRKILVISCVEVKKTCLALLTWGIYENDITERYGKPSGPMPFSGVVDGAWKGSIRKMKIVDMCDCVKEL